MRAADLAKRIPKDVRDLLLDTNAIYRAACIPNDEYMKMLFAVWTTYIDSQTYLDKETCVYCLQEIRQNFIYLQDALTASRRADELLNL